MIDLTPPIKELHNAYCIATDRPIALSLPVMGEWEAWMLHGWSKAELLLVIAYIKRQIQKRKREPVSLRLHLLLERSRFEDDLIDARQAMRRPPPSARDRILQATHRTVQETKPAESVGQILSRPEFAAKLREWKEQNL